MPHFWASVRIGSLLAVGLLCVMTSSAPASCETFAAAEGVCANPKRFSSSSTPAVYEGRCASGAPLLLSGDSCQQKCPDGLARKYGQAEILTCASGKSSALPLECRPSECKGLELSRSRAVRPCIEALCGIVGGLCASRHAAMACQACGFLAWPACSAVNLAVAGFSRQSSSSVRRARPRGILSL